MNAKFLIDKPIAIIWKNFVEFCVSYFDIFVLVH